MVFTQNKATAVYRPTRYVPYMRVKRTYELLCEFGMFLSPRQQRVQTFLTASYLAGALYRSLAAIPGPDLDIRFDVDFEDRNSLSKVGATTRDDYRGIAREQLT